MRSPDQIVNRLQQQKNQTARMLSPGSKRLRGDQASWNFSPVAPDFGGRKFQLAAKKMRILDKEKLGASRTGKASIMADSMQAKFQNAQNMLHISFAGKSENSFWSEIKKVFPNQESGRVETPLEPDQMRRGSIIQQFNTFPKPGQTLESFKEQAQRNPAVRKPAVSLPKKTNLDPKDRLFSRVQELTAGQKEKNTVEQVGTDKPVESSPPASSEKIQRQVEQALPPAARQSKKENLPPVSSEKIQRQTEQTLPPVARESAKESLPPVSSEKIQRQVEQTLPPAARESKKENLPPVSNEKNQPQMEQPSQPESHEIKAETKALESAVASKPEIMLARLTQKPKKDSPKLPTALPLKKPNKSGVPKINLPPVQVPLNSAPSAPIGQVIQRQLDVKKSPQEPDVQPENYQLESTPESEIKIPIRQEPITEEVQQVKDIPEMPLKEHIERHQAVFGRLKNTVGHLQSTKARDMTHLKIDPAQYSMTANKYHQTKPKTDIAFDAPLPANLRSAKQPSPQPQSDLPLYQSVLLPPVASEVGSEVSSQTVPQKMTLAKMPAQKAMVEKAAIIQPPPMLPNPAKPAQNNSVGSVAPIPRTAPQKVIQRIWEEHGDVQHAQGQQAQSDQGQSEASDVNQLAEKIFPLVKHLLQIESERTGSRFR